MANALEIKNLDITYLKTAHKAVSGFSLKIEKGEILVILGPSGCGKTTLLNAIAGIFSESEVEIEGEINFPSRHATTAMVFQRPTLLPWVNVTKNISLGLEPLEYAKASLLQKTESALKMVGLEKFADYYPGQLSFGMQQRVNFARALVCEPEILLLDEPFSALDVNRKKKIQKEFLEIIKKKNITAIFVTHNIEEALEIGDKIYVFFDGKNIKKGLYANKFKGMDKDNLYLNAQNYLHACQ